MGLSSGATLGSYQIVSPLGAGGMGEVYRARDKRLGRDVALKILPESLEGDPDRAKRLRHEAKTVAALNHPNIITIFSVEEANGIQFITMELVDGKPLVALLPPEGLALERFFSVATPLADAVASAHAHGIVHRDLKPANVMVTEEGRVKVLDFGLAKVVHAPVPAASTKACALALASRSQMPPTEEGVIVGTPHYMSPEQARGELVDHRSDIFSLGVMFFEMATGTRPFQGESSLDVLAAVVRGQIEYTDQFSVQPESQALERRPISGMAFVRDPALRANALQRAKGLCEYCGTLGFRMENGTVFLETHHVVPLGEGGIDAESNIAAICPNHHREAHHGVRANEIRQALLIKLKRLSGR